MFPGQGRFKVAALGQLFFLGVAWASLLWAQEIHPLVGGEREDPLERFGITRESLEEERPEHRVRYREISRYLNGARAVVTTSIDDSTPQVPACLDALDRFGIKASVAISTRRGPILELWVRLRKAIEDGHEIASHSRNHQCQWPDTAEFCRRAYSRDEVEGSRQDILANTAQPYVWSWVYPCGNCAGYEFVHERLRSAGYLVARNYPDEPRGGILLPNLQTWALDPYDAGFTQVVQKRGGIAPAGRTDVPELNRQFDQVYENGGIYHFVSHPQWLDYGPESFYEQHLRHLGGRPDVWYVPLGPLYAYQAVAENTVVARIGSEAGRERFFVYHRLDPRVYPNSVTLEFELSHPAALGIYVDGTRLAERDPSLPTDRWDGQYFRREGERWWITLKPNSMLEWVPEE